MREIRSLSVADTVGLFITGGRSRALTLSSLRVFFCCRGNAEAGYGFSFPATQKTTAINHVPTFDGQASSFLGFGRRVVLRNGSTDIPAEKRATSLIHHIDATARRVCQHSGGDSLMGGDDVRAAIQGMRDYIRPDAIGRIFRQVGKFMTIALLRSF